MVVLEMLVNILPKMYFKKQISFYEWFTLRQF